MVKHVYAETPLSDTLSLNGDIRAVYYGEESGGENESILGLGLNPTLTNHSFFDGNLQWKVGAGMAVPLSESSKGYGAEAGMAQSGDVAYGNNGADASESYATLTQLNATYDFGTARIKAGYQLMDTPMPEKDDIRLVPNSYLAAVADYTGFDDLILIAGYVARMAGAVDSSASDNPHAYHSMSDAAVGGILADAGVGDNHDVDDRGVGVAAIMYADERHGIDAQFWRYQMEEPYAGLGDFVAMYADAGIGINNFYLSVQHMRYKNDVWMNTASGAMAEAAWGDISVTAAYNSYTVNVEKRSLADTLGLGDAPVPTWYAWGRYPEFVAGEEVDASFGDWDGGSAMMIGAGYSEVENLEVSAIYLSYTNTVEAVDVVADYAIDDAMSLTLIYEVKRYEGKYKTAEDVDDTTTAEAKFYYLF